MTPDEIIASRLLQGVAFPYGTWDKRMGKHLGDRTVPPPGCTFYWQPTISDMESPQLWRLLLRYRRQWHHPEQRRLIGVAAKLSVPAKTKAAVAAENAKGQES